MRILLPSFAFAAGGDLNLTVRDETTGEPTIVRVELTRAAPATKRPSTRRKSNEPMSMPRTVGAGRGFVLDRELDLTLADGAYQFRITRGLESRVLTGNFALERTSSDAHVLTLPRIVNLRSLGWTSGDCFVPPSTESLAMRMAAEDLHFAMRGIDSLKPEMVSVREKPVPGRLLPPGLGTAEHGLDDRGGQGSAADATNVDQWPTDPLWIGETARHVGGLVFYAKDSDTAKTLDALIAEAIDASPFRTPEGDASAVLSAVAKGFPHNADAKVRVAIENPLARSVPIWLASQRIDGVFVLGDWIGLDQPLMQMPGGHRVDAGSHRDATSLGREVERVYWNILDAGIAVVPLAGCGDGGGELPVGFNRLYVAGKKGGRLLNSSDNFNEQPIAVQSADQWWAAAWAGQSVATNGPLLQPTLAGRLPGHVFELRDGQSLSLTPELTLAVRDPVDYLEVIHNGRVHYSARLDEYAKAGGQIPPIQPKEPGWAVIRVVTLQENHFQAAMTGAWWFERPGTVESAGQGRVVMGSVSSDAVAFFRDWLSKTEEALKTLPADEISAYAPLVRVARQFWQQRQSLTQ